MRYRFCTAALIAALCISLFAGCAAAQPLDTAANYAASRPSPSTTTAAVPAVPAVRLTKEDAIAIALKDAGLQQSDVIQLRTELDYDNGRAAYEVDFHHNRWEFDYEIDADTGSIISFDKDLED